MRTSAKIVALMATSSNAFLTEMFSTGIEAAKYMSAETVDATVEQSEEMYSAYDFLYYNYYNGAAEPFYYSNSNAGYFLGPYGGNAYGSYDYYF